MKTFLAALLLCLLGYCATAQNGNLTDFKTLNRQAGELMRRGQADSQLMVSRQMLILAQQSRNDSLLTESYVSLGNGFALKSDFENALNYFLKGLHVAEEKDLAEPEIHALIDIGSLYEDMENYTEARKYIQKVIALLPRSVNPLQTEIYAHGNLALVYSLTGRLEQARQELAASDKAYQKSRQQHGDDHYVASYQLYLASLIKNTDSVYRQAAAYSRQYGQTYTLAKVENAYGKFLLAAKRLPEAVEIARSSVQLSLTAGFSADAIQGAGLLSKIYDLQHRADSANFYYRLKDSLQQKVYDRQRLNRLQDMTFTEQIRQQEEAARADELAFERRNNLQYAGIAVLLISLVIVYLALSRKAAKHPGLVEFLGIVGLLVFFEFVNLLLHPLLGKFTHESPIWMLLLMVLLAALLVPLHHRMEALVKQKAGKRAH